MTRTRRRRLWVFEAVLLVAGALSLGWFGWNWLEASVDQSWSSYVLNAGIRGVSPSFTGYLAELFGRDSAEKQSSAVDSNQQDPLDQAPREIPEPPKMPRKLPAGEMIGRLEIPRIQIRSVVRSGVDDRTLKRAAGHVPYTALPGQPGNVGVAAHRDTFFRNLRNVKVGDVIRMVTPEGTYQYKVDSLKIVWPRNVEVLDPTPEPALTLVTCYPFNYVGSAPKRFIVRAREISRPAGITAGSETPTASPSKTS